MKEKQQAFANRIRSETERLIWEVITDIHITLPTDSKKLDQAIQDMWKRKIRYAAVLGDLSNNGYSFQLKSCLNTLKEYPIQYLIALGNHDTISLFHKNQIHIHPLYKEMVLKHHHSLYYDEVICGIHFYVLNSEQPDKSNAHYSQNQLDWLKKGLNNDDTNYPVFILCHHPLPDTHADTGDITTHCGVQENSILKILQQHPKAVYISGHLHHGYDCCTPLFKEQTALIDVPSFTHVESGEDKGMCGYQIQVFSDFLYIRTRNYANASWIKSQEFILDLSTHLVIPFDADLLPLSDTTER